MYIGKYKKFKHYTQFLLVSKQYASLFPLIACIVNY